MQNITPFIPFFATKLGANSKTVMCLATTVLEKKFVARKKCLKKNTKMEGKIKKISVEKNLKNNEIQVKKKNNKIIKMMDFF